MMWNFLVGALLSEAAIVLYDGSPAHPDLGVLWELAERAGITCMGVSAGLLGELREGGRASPARDHDLARAARDRLDRLAARAGELPLGLRARRPGRLAVLDQRRHRRLHRLRRRAVRCCPSTRANCRPRARLRGRGLGRAGHEPDRRGRRAGDHGADALDAAVLLGRAGRRAPARELLLDVPGRLAPRRLDPHHPARRRGHLRPLGLDDQPPGRAHGHERDLPGRAAVPEVLDALVVDVPGGEARRGELWMVLFVVLATGVALDEELAARSSGASARTARRATSPTRCCRSPRCRARSPARSLEVPVKRILMGAPAEQAASVDSLANPAALDYFVELSKSL